MFSDVQATILIDLGSSEEDLWKNLHKDARWGVKKARKEKLDLEIEVTNELWEKFYQIYKITIISGGVAPKPLLDLKKETDKLFLCKLGKEVIAGAALKINSNQSTLFLNASLPEFLKLQPNNFLYWEIISWSKKNKLNFFDLGGYQLNAKEGSKLYNINRFKEKWGGKIVFYKIRSNNPFYILGRKVIRNIHFIKKLKDKFTLAKWKKKNKSRLQDI